MRQCEYCGSELRAKARFCGHCGKKVGSESEVTTNVDDALVVNMAESPLATTAALSELQDTASENDGEDEEQLAQLALEDDGEEKQTENPGLNSSMLGDLDVEPEIQASPSAPSPLRGEGAEGEAALVATGKDDGKGVSAPGVKTRSGSVPKALLILITVLIITAGCAAALIRLFQWHLPGTRGAAGDSSSSSVSEIVNTAGPPLNATVCPSTSTYATPVTSGGIGLTRSATSGCSSFIAATASSLCLIFPSNPGTLPRYILNVSNVMVDSKPYHLVLGIAAYTGSASYNDGEHVTVGIGDGPTGGNFSWLYRSGNVTIKSGEQSGTMDVMLESASSGKIIHVVGSWTCGRLIKNK